LTATIPRFFLATPPHIHLEDVRMKFIVLCIACLILALALGGCAYQPFNNPWILQQGDDMPADKHSAF
jgi:hypothetical protein